VGSIAGVLVGSALVAAFLAALIIILVTRSRPRASPLLAATILVAMNLVAAAMVPAAVPLALTIPLALLGVAIALLGGAPAARCVLSLASNSMVREGPNGGILLRTPTMTTEPAPEVMRGGVTIGYLERAATALAIIVGYPEAIAV